MGPMSSGAVKLSLSPNAPSASGPVVVILPGALRLASDHQSWFERLGDRPVAIADLPGHGRSARILPVTLENFAAEIGKALEAEFSARDLVLVGESLGGLIALRLASAVNLRVRGVVAVDPPMSTAKLWHIHMNYRQLLEANPEAPAMRGMAQNIFGVEPEGVSDKIYLPLLERLEVPVTIITGDFPLFPRRSLTDAPCLFDATDQYVVRRFYPQVALTVVEGCGHLLLRDAPDVCEAIIRTMVEAASPASVDAAP